MRFLILAGALFPALCCGQSPYWVYRSAPQALDCIYPGSAVPSASPITKTLADDISCLSQFVGEPVTAIAATFYNYNEEPVAFRPRFRFWHADGGGGSLGTYFGEIGFSGDDVRISSYTTHEVVFDLSSSSFSVPSGAFWAGVALDNEQNKSGLAEADDLNSIGVMPGSPVIGLSNANFFESSLAQDLYSTSYPTGSYSAGNLAISLGIAGQDAFGVIHLTNVVSQMAHPKTIFVTAQSGATTLASQTVVMGSQATSQQFWVTVPAEWGNEVTVRVGGKPFLYKSFTFTPDGQGTIPIDLGSIPLINGDANGSGEVDPIDIDMVISNFGNTFPGEIGDPYTDLNSSGEVDPIDIDIVISNFGYGNE